MEGKANTSILDLASIDIHNLKENLHIHNYKKTLLF